MNRYRWLTASLGVLLVALIAGAVAIALHNNITTPSTASDETPQTGPGPFLTASTMPAALAARPVPHFDLVDARGGKLSSSTLTGRPYVITFLYVHCADVCPLIGSEIHEALANLGPTAKQMTVIGISVDPRGDTRKAVTGWLKLHHEPANFHYLIGSTHTLAPVWKAFYVTPQTPGDPNSSHTAIIWLVNRHGRPAALIPAGVPISTTKLAHDFRVLVQDA